jgi:hypothetical protein
MSEDNYDGEEIRKRMMQLVIPMLELFMSTGNKVNQIDRMLACEFVASIQRRIGRDSGATKEQVNAMRAAASELAGQHYESSGCGQRARADFAAFKKAEEERVRQESGEGRFTEEEWRVAEEAAMRAIDAAMGAVKQSTNSKEQGP